MRGQRGKSQLIIQELREKILSGELPENHKFETMAKFAASMGTTVATIDKVFAVLQKNGLIERINGKGIFVAGTNRVHYVLVFDTLAECGAYGHKAFFVQKIREECKNKNIRLTVFENIDTDVDSLKVRRFLLDNPCDAIGLASQNFADDIEKYMRDINIPVIGLHRYITLENSVTYDRTWLNEANDLLRQHNCNSVAIITGATQTRQWESDSSFSERALKNNLVSEEDLYHCNWLPREGYNAALNFLDKNPSRPCGIVSTDSILTLGIISAVLQKGLKVMEDVIIISHINRGNILSEFPVPVLKCVCNINEQVSIFMETSKNPSGHITVATAWDDSEVAEMLKKNEKGILFPVGHVDNIPYFMPPVHFNEEKELAEVLKTNELNRKSALEYPKNAEAKISGTFIYAQPPDYRGFHMHNAGADDWRKIFKRLKKMNMKTVIFQASLWNELNECFYNSRHFDNMQCYNVLENMFDAAESEEMEVFLGGYGSCAGWQKNLSESDMQRELDNHRKCFEEICNIGRIAGAYFPAETAFKGSRDAAKEAAIHDLYKFFTSMVKEKNADYKVIISPVTAPFDGKEKEFVDFWNTVLLDSGVDILMPQDSVGSGVLLCNSVHRWKYWQECAAANNMELWANIELFERQGYKPKTNLVPAEVERVNAQITNAAPFVNRLMCWEAMYFASPEAGKRGRALQKFLEK